MASQGLERGAFTASFFHHGLERAQGARQQLLGIRCLVGGSRQQLEASEEFLCGGRVEDRTIDQQKVLLVQAIGRLQSWNVGFKHLERQTARCGHHAVQQIARSARQAHHDSMRAVACLDSLLRDGSGRNASDTHANARVCRLLAGVRVALAGQQCMAFRKIAAHAAARQVIGHHAHACQFAQVLSA